MQQLDLLDYQPEPEQIEESQTSTRFQQGDRVIADGKEGRIYYDDGSNCVWIERGNVATPHDRPTVEPCEPIKPTVNTHARAWQEGNIAYYRRLMLRFMELQQADSEATPAKQAARRHMISHLHGLCEECLIKIKQLGGE